MATACGLDSRPLPAGEQTATSDAGPNDASAIDTFVPDTGAGESSTRERDRDDQSMTLVGENAASTCPNGDGTYCGGHGVDGDEARLYTCSAGKLITSSSCSNGCERIDTGGSDRCTAPPATASCPNGDGTYCGGHGIDGDADTLHECVSGKAVPSTPCSHGCEPIGKGGDDQCSSPPALTLCPNGDGKYCGEHGVNGDPYTLHDCVKGKLSVSIACSGGCEHVGDGGNDRCAALPPPMPRCPNGDGTYCGEHGIPGGNNTLYDCVSGIITISSLCIQGCETVDSGGGDRCTPPKPMPQCPNGDGKYCGGHGFVGLSNILHDCVGGDFSISSVCAYGCEQIGSGGSDRCITAPNPPPPPPPIPMPGAPPPPNP